MKKNTLYKKSILKLSNLTKKEILTIINLSKILKNKKKQKTEKKYLKKKNIALIFEKESTRTRCACEISCFDQGANSTYLGPHSLHLGKKESIKDTARVLERMYDAILYRGCKHKRIKKLAKYASIPVWNGLTDQFHPTQLLADLLTIKENKKKKSLTEIKVVFVGDIYNNIANSIVELATLMKIKLTLIGPEIKIKKKNYFFKQIKKKKIKNISYTKNIQKGVKNADFIYTDVWISMGEKEKKWNEKISLFKKYQINKTMLQHTKNPKVKILHCLPSFHNKETIFGKKIIEKNSLKDGLEITNEIFESNKEIIFSQSENRLHTIKAVMLLTLLPTKTIKKIFYKNKIK